MISKNSCLITLSVILATVNCATIAKNVAASPRIQDSEQLLSSIVNDCFDSNAMSCVKGKVLNYLDTVLGLSEDESRAAKNIDRVIYDRVARLLANNEFRVELPEVFFQKSVVTYNAKSGLDIEVPKEAVEQARGHMLKKKLLLPVLLLLKLKMKALMPILVAITGLKAMKALILSKLAITIVLGFVIYQLVQKAGMKMPMTMAMNPMMAESLPYNAPAPSVSTPSPSYEAGAWNANTGPYSRWDTSDSSASHNLAYSSYNPSSSSYSSGSSSGSSPSSTYSSSSSISNPGY